MTVKENTSQELINSSESKGNLNEIILTREQIEDFKDFDKLKKNKEGLISLHLIIEREISNMIEFLSKLVEITELEIKLPPPLLLRQKRKEHFSNFNYNLLTIKERTKRLMLGYRDFIAKSVNQLADINIKLITLEKEKGKNINTSFSS